MRTLLVCLVLSLSIYSCSSSKQASSPVAVNSTNDGSSYEKAIVINAKNEQKGVAAEYEWLRNNYPGYKLIKQSLQSKGQKHYDAMLIKTKQGEEKTIYFDITNFFGKGFGF